jgi:hypothetical protein
MLFSVGYTLPYDQSGVIYSLSHVQNFLGDEGDSAPFKPPKQKGAHPPSGNYLMYLLVGGRAEKMDTFLTTFLKQKKVLRALIMHFSPFETTKRGVEKALKGVYIT